jgi:hypothetical protein
MNPKVTRALQNMFWCLGWAILALTVVHVGVEAYSFYSTSMFQRQAEFSFVRSASALLSSVGAAFFAFLMSAVFGMLFHRAPVESQKAEAFLVLCCLGFAGEGVVRIVSWGLWLRYASFDLSSALGWLSVSSTLLSLCMHLVSLVYAITIYVLYRHFYRLVSFESEVV